MTPTIERNDTTRISGALFFSFAAFFVMYVLFPQDFSAFAEQKSIFEDFGLLVKIMVINVCTSLAVCVLWVLLKRYLFTWAVNLVNKALKKTAETRNPTIWIDIFEDNYIGSLDNVVVKVEKDGITSTGLLDLYSSASPENCEILLSHITQIEEYFKFDAKGDTAEEDKFFTNILYEYVNLEKGVKVTFYDSEKFRRLNMDNGALP